MSLHRRQILIGLAGGLTLAGARPASAQAPDPVSRYAARLRAALAEGLPDGQAADALLPLTNRFRAGQGQPPLQAHPGLALAARAHAADLGSRGYFEHRSPEGYTASERIGLLARDFCGAGGENIAMRQGRADHPAADQFLDMWISSPGHRENLLRDSFTHAGHGVVRFEDSTYAAAVYGGLAARLGPELPLQPSPQDVANALQGAQPAIGRFEVSPVGTDTRSGPWQTDHPPAFAPGAWRLRPWVKAGEANHFNVVWGPIFVVGG